MEQSAADLLRPIGPGAALQGLLQAERAVLYKHSPICGTSDLALRQVKDFAKTHPEVPVYLIDVIAQRDLSNRLALLLAVGHESPQVILLRCGSPCWTGSHFEITAERISGHLGDC